LSLFLGDDIFGILEGLFESILESFPGLGSSSLGLSSSLRSFGLEGSLLLGSSILVFLGNERSLLLGEWVEFVHHSFVLKRVLLGLVVGSDVLSHISQLGLDLIGVDDSSDISASHNGSVQSESRFLSGFLVVSSENGGEAFESILGIDDESTEVTSWSELKNIESSDVASVNTWEISGSLLDVS